MWKVKIYEVRATYPQGEEPGKEDLLLHTLESSDKTVLAAFLRGVADSYDPKKHLRDH